MNEQVERVHLNNLGDFMAMLEVAAASNHELEMEFPLHPRD